MQQSFITIHEFHSSVSYLRLLEQDDITHLITE